MCNDTSVIMTLVNESFRVNDSHHVNWQNWLYYLTDSTFMHPEPETDESWACKLPQILLLVSVVLEWCWPKPYETESSYTCRTWWFSQTFGFTSGIQLHYCFYTFIYVFIWKTIQCLFDSLLEFFRHEERMCIKLNYSPFKSLTNNK